jgi:hypothetical protein
MRRLVPLVLTASLAMGCSLVWGPDRGRIRDSGPEDAGVVDAGDAGDAGDGGDAGDDGDGGGCVPEQEQETDCADMEDDDCDGFVDCFDFDCRGVARCCQSSTPDPTCFADASGAGFVSAPSGAGGPTVVGTCPASGTSASITRFSSVGQLGALITRECQPVTYGMRYDLEFAIATGCSGAPCDWAGVAFGPVQGLMGGSFASELAVKVFADGSATIDRAGTNLGGVPAGTFRTIVGTPISVRLELEPGPTDSGRDAVFVTVEITQDSEGGTILERTPAIPFENASCVTAMGQAGLYVAVLGSGSGVVAEGPLERVERQCSTPSQFMPLAPSPDLSAVEACAMGGAGAPAIASYCHSGCGAAGASAQWELWVDASARPREDDEADYIDFGVCGSTSGDAAFPSGSGAGTWQARPAVGTTNYLWAIDGAGQSSREPTILPISDDAASMRVQELFYAYARRAGDMTDELAIWGGVISRRPDAGPSTNRELLAITDTTNCIALRDPLLVADYVDATGGSGHRVGGAWLLFSCIRGLGRQSIGVARFDDALALVAGTVDESFFQVPMTDTYAFRGVSGPEGFTEVLGDQLTLRLWFTGRDGGGVLSVGFAQGRGPLGEGLPVPAPYPANPVLSASSPVLGGDCTAGCRLTGLGVTPSFNDLGDYQFVVSRSVGGATTTHELVPLLQPRPLNE